MIELLIAAYLVSLVLTLLTGLFTRRLDRSPAPASGPQKNPLWREDEFAAPRTLTLYERATRPGKRG